MKIKFYWLALLASAAMIAQANAGGHHGGGGSGGSVAVSGPSNSGRSAAVSSVRSMPMHTLSSGRMIYSGQRFSSASLHSPSLTAFRPYYANPNAHASVRSHQITRENIARGNNVARSSNGNRTISHVSRTRNGTAQVKNGNATLRADWRN
ncbi:MAG TPA: hypothetical protein VJR49_00490, partial [Chthoniobacterales bacterium]|nr:hypothetical protein [Chthoniobacterales bacterium]